MGRILMVVVEHTSSDARLAWVERQFWIDQDVALAAAEDWLAELDPADDGALRRRLEVQRASIMTRRGDPRQGAATVQRILDWAEEHGDRTLQSRCHEVLGSIFELVGDRALALEHAVATNDLLDADESPLMRSAARLTLADALGSAGSFDESRRRYGEALRLVIDDPETGIRYTILNNLAYTEYLADNQDAALAAVENLIALSTLHDRPIGMYARDTIARVYLTAGRLDEAEATLLAAMEAKPVDYLPDSIAAALVTLIETYRRQGCLVEAQTVVDQCLALTTEHGLVRWATEVAREQAEIFAALEDYKAAFEAYRSYHAQSVALTAGENESRGSILEAMFQAAESRRESERYREMAQRDPLTELHNRRFADDHLGTLLTELREGGPPVAIAMLDVDHFKRINDDLTHAVGDQVLQVLARILADPMKHLPGGIAARLGGEEFLLVMPGVTADDAFALCEKVRAAVAGYDWSAINAGLRVTASLGVAVAPTDADTGAALLRVADVRMYVAKRDGRNRVVFQGD
ncbi:diguanylate cyclase [Cryobacterium sp. 1639]|uniref:tetratricopeptide repeat-containing diguanylate cyclase n=1 Tax=Cryobacterium inferilacus TaxID=2866629 RepID=UPI001C73D16C|nr:diguanylate cyclase [Cryobacterium sp. 1639]MBX0299340.1 diguanylate cyclase [Cryobacterium sp. 1639]